MNWLKSLTTANRDLFPTTWSYFIFVSYMSLFVSQGLLVTASRYSSFGHTLVN